MAYGGTRLLSLPDHTERLAPNNMDQLAFKYMDMCKVESSTDSESEISPRWSDTSTMGCSSSAPESRTFQRTLPLTKKPAVKHGCYSLFLDPYDGSSEDSDESHMDGGVLSKRARQQGRGGGGQFMCRSRRLILHNPPSVALRGMMKTGMRNQQHLSDIKMTCGSDSELWVCKLACKSLQGEATIDSSMPSQAMEVEFDYQFDDSGLHATAFTSPASGPVTPVERSFTRMAESSSERSPSPAELRSLYKRKLGFPGAEVIELGQRKRMCVLNMEDSASEPC